jgi:hypothetical protein
VVVTPHIVDTTWPSLIRGHVAIVRQLFPEHYDSFYRLCRRADAAARKRPIDPATERLRQLLDDDVSLERAWAEINGNRPTPEATVEAIKEAVRRRGASALDEPRTRDRLAQCDAKALKAIDRWLIDFEREGFDQCSSSTPSSPS